MSRAGIVCVASVACVLAGGCGLLHELFPSEPLPEQIALVTVAEGFTSPLALVFPPDGSGRMFVVDQIGVVHVIDSAGQVLETPFLDLRSRMVEIGIDFGGGLVFDERGLLGLAFHPQYAANGRLFVVYNAPPGDDLPDSFDSESRLAEFRVRADDANQADADSERILLRIGKPQFNHNGGQIEFGPDGLLYWSVGDGGAANDVGDGHTPGVGNAQDLSVLLGKILRLDVDGGEPYAIPPDNPFVGDAVARPEIYAYGLRNPWRFSFDTHRGRTRLFVADVGQNLFEEINLVQRGGNYGWNIREAAHCFDPNNADSPPATCPQTGARGEPLIDPIIEYPQTADDGTPVGIAVIGGYVYRGEALPGLSGAYVFGDWSTSFAAADGTIFVATESAGAWTRSELTIAGRPDGRLGRFVLGFGRDTEGELYVLTTENVGPFGATGRVERIVPVEP